MIIDILNIIDTYTAWHKANGDTAQGVGWDAESQQLLFERTAREFTIGTLLDFGCGLAHFGEYLKKYKPQIIYTGVDINPVYVRETERKGFIAYCGTVDNGVDMPKFDYVVALGTFHYFENQCTNLKKTIREYVNHLLPITKKKLIFTAVDKNEMGYATIAKKQLRSIAPMRIEKINGMFFCVIEV